MICFKCHTQMKQYKDVGGGTITPDGLTYITWELKICPNCGIMVKESYEAEVLSEYQVQEILNEYQSKGTGKKN